MKFVETCHVFIGRLAKFACTSYLYIIRRTLSCLRLTFEIRLRQRATMVISQRHTFCARLKLFVNHDGTTNYVRLFSL